MCNEFLIDDKYLTSISELRDFLGDKDIPISKEYGEFSKDIASNETCLCPVDIQELVDLVEQDAVLDGDKIVFGKHIEDVEPDYRFNHWQVQKD